MKSKWKKLALPGFYERKTEPNGDVYYVRESTTRGKGNPVAVPPGEEGVFFARLNFPIRSSKEKVILNIYF